MVSLDLDFALGVDCVVTVVVVSALGADDDCDCNEGPLTGL